MRHDLDKREHVRRARSSRENLDRIRSMSSRGRSCMVAMPVAQINHIFDKSIDPVRSVEQEDILTE